MPKRDIPIPIIPEDEMYTEDGFPSAKLLETHYRYMMQKYGPMEIVHRGPSIVDVLAECEIIDAEDEAKQDAASKNAGGSKSE
ncbi:hypothetical protein [Fluviibacter phosphoraccumulans]|uniref:Uncharacterized protein n=1 Tax=Fluviibacter phosphoraccumulans TaxID=1751046 RepID=A0A7R6QX25_9RHOO|nr:hypothetical protein [Fluviibacter phosphoraccumulans]BBU68666.1 hypothetical protein ICHIAU1_09490 [Fluviibacter phosphoraccumulans]BBU72179.1 hypothetical protein ICHIJ1_20980 [Fluviibacter phosphoraccumulans]